MRKEGYNWNYTGDWYLLRAKFMNDWNFFVREVGRGRGVQERNLEVTEVLRRGGRRWCRHEAGLDIFLKKDLESLSRLSFSELRLVTMVYLCQRVVCLFKRWCKCRCPPTATCDDWRRRVDSRRRGTAPWDIIKCFVDQHRQLEVDTLTYWNPAELSKKWCNVITSPVLVKPHL